MPNKYNALRKPDPYAEPDKLHQIEPRDLGSFELPRRARVKVPRHKQKMKYNRSTDEWEGPLPDGRRAHVSNKVYWEYYHGMLGDKNLTTQERSERLTAMTHAPFWADEASKFETENKFISPDLYISGEQSG